MSSSRDVGIRWNELIGWSVTVCCRLTAGPITALGALVVRSGRLAVRGSSSIREWGTRTRFPILGLGNGRLSRRVVPAPTEGGPGAHWGQ